MIDIHSHILPNIDDGSRSVEETFTLIKEAKEAGFEAIISTSHYMKGYYETDAPERKVWLNIIHDKLKEKDIDIELFLGNEIYITDDIIPLLEEQKASTINDTGYVLIELPLNAEVLNLFDMIYELKDNKLVPILAHPERYSFLHKDPDMVFELIEIGVLMQCNYGSILGLYGEKSRLMMEKLLENNMVHFLGSDVHRQNTIYPKIPDALKKIRSIVGVEKLNELTTVNPRKVVNNKRIDIDMPLDIDLTFKERLTLAKGSSFKAIVKNFLKV